MTLSDTARYVVLPIFFTFLGTLIAAVVRFLQDRSERKRTNRDQQMTKAVSIGADVMEVGDKLLSCMKNDAWYVAYRSSDTTTNYPEDLIKSDAEKWNQYEAALCAWNSKELTFDTELKGSFGVSGVEAILYEEIHANVSRMASMLWRVRFASKDGSSAVLLPSPDGATDLTTNQTEDWTEEDHRKNRDAYFEILRETKIRVTVMSNAMIHCLQQQFVGNLQHVGEMDRISEEDQKQLEKVGSKYVDKNPTKGDYSA